MTEEATEPDKERTPATGDQRGAASLDSLSRTFVRFTVLVALMLAALKVLDAFDVGTVWDDAYIFQRYATNLLDGEGIRWNPGSHEPSYGLTSIAFLLPATLMNIVAGGNTTLAALLSSSVCGVVFVLLTLWLLYRHVDGPWWARVGGVVLFTFTFALSEAPLHLDSGMDTTFAMAFVAGYIIVAQRWHNNPSRRDAILLGVLGALSFSVRPELVAYGIGIPLVIAMLSKGQARKHGGLALLVAVGVIGAQLLFCRFYFHSPVPLPFYAKGLRIYGDNIFKVYRGVAGTEFAAYVGHFWLLFALVLVDVTRFRHWQRSTSPVEKGILVASAACLLYYLSFVLPVMGFSQRFFHPPLAALAFLAAQSLGRIARDFEAREGLFPVAVGRAMACVALAFLWFWLLPALSEEGKRFAEISSKRRWRLDVHKHATRGGPRGYWFAVDEIMALPDDAVIATTEVGMPGVLAPNKRIVDLAGLNERTLAQHPFDAEWVLRQYWPDVLYMPHEHYKRMTRDLKTSAAFKNYELFSKRTLKTQFGMAVRKNSKHYDRIIAIVDRKAAPKTKTPARRRRR